MSPESAEGALFEDFYSTFIVAMGEGCGLSECPEGVLGFRLFETAKRQVSRCIQLMYGCTVHRARCFQGST